MLLPATTTFTTKIILASKPTKSTGSGSERTERIARRKTLEPDYLVWI
jgi:hypothetical protein